MGKLNNINICNIFNKIFLYIFFINLMNINNDIIRLKREINEIKYRNNQLLSKNYKSNSKTNEYLIRNENIMLNQNNFYSQNNNKNNKKVQKKNNLKINSILPFKKGLFSYQNPYKESPMNKKLKTCMSSISIIPPPNLNFNSNYNKLGNYFSSTLNLNKYKIIIKKDNIKLDTILNTDEKSKSDNQNLKTPISNNLFDFTFNQSEKKLKENNENKKLILEDDNYNNKKLYEKENRRMIIEYIKILMKTENKELNKIIKANKFSEKLLNQKKINNEKPQQNNLYPKNSSISFISVSDVQSIFPEMKNKKNSYLTSYNNFINQMKDYKIDKIKMLKYLSIPRKFKLSFKDNNYEFIFLLRPNNLSFLKGIESYVFQWLDIENKSYIGGFDLIKINSCYIKNDNPNKFIIETFDSENKRLYEFDTNSFEISSYYVKSLNYLNQLEKCKIYNNNYFS